VNRHLLLLAVALTLALPSLAQLKPEGPQPGPGNVTLSLDEYNRLLTLANRVPKKSEAPPVPYIVKQAALKFRVSNDDVLGSIQFEGETLGTNATKVPLASGVTVFDARHGVKPLPLLLENGTHVAILPGESEFNVSLDAGLALTIDAGRAGFSVPVPLAGSVRLSLTVPGERTNVQLNHGIITHRASVGGNTEIEATLVPGQIANVWWNTREVVAPVAPREVRYLSDVKSLVSVTESDLQIAALVDLNVVQGESEQFSLAVPEGFEVTAVNGPSLESSEVQNGVLILRIPRQGPAAHQFLISLERPINDAKTSAPILTFQDAQRETGEILVEGQGTLELTAKESGGLKRLDIKEVNPYLRALSRYSLQAAFRYHRQPKESPALALEWTRFPDSSVLAAIAERATVTTLVTSEGKSLTEVKLIVKNQAQPFLKVQLPAGATILTAEVSGEKVKPVQGADGDRVPLLRSGFRPAGAYTVSFVFLHPGAPFARKGDSNIALPKMDVPISILEWELFLPEQFKVKDFSGDAISATLLPPQYVFYALNPSNSLGVGEGSGVGGMAGGVMGGVIGGSRGGLVALPMNGRNITSLAELAPGVTLSPGQLGGIIVDPSGAVMPGVQVEVQNTATGATWNASTAENGQWFLLGVPTGVYQISAAAPGFQTIRQAVSYNAASPTAYRLALNAGTVSEQIVVESTAGRIDTDASTLPVLKDKKHKGAQPMAPPPAPQASANVFNLQQRVAGVLPVAVDVPRTGTSYRFFRPLIVNEETKLSFSYKSK
jgi:Carboxypeptidase regulatory-like domain